MEWNVEVHVWVTTEEAAHYSGLRYTLAYWSSLTHPVVVPRTNHHQLPSSALSQWWLCGPKPQATRRAVCHLFVCVGLFVFLVSLCVCLHFHLHSRHGRWAVFVVFVAVVLVEVPRPGT